jgi:hypothetical protein
LKNLQKPSRSGETKRPKRGTLRALPKNEKKEEQRKRDFLLRAASGKLRNMHHAPATLTAPAPFAKLFPEFLCSR